MLNADGIDSYVANIGKCFVEKPKKKHRGCLYDLHNFQLCFFTYQYPLCRSICKLRIYFNHKMINMIIILLTLVNDLQKTQRRRRERWNERTNERKRQRWKKNWEKIFGWKNCREMSSWSCLSQLAKSFILIAMNRFFQCQFNSTFTFTQLLHFCQWMFLQQHLNSQQVKKAKVKINLRLSNFLFPI